MTTGLIAIDATILATAVPTIVDELGGFEAFPWLFSVHLVAAAAAMPRTPVRAQAGSQTA